MKRITPEPLSDNRWAKIERDVFRALEEGAPELATARPSARPRASRPAFWVGGSAALCVAAAVLFLSLRATPVVRPALEYVSTEERGEVRTIDGVALALAPHTTLVARRAQRDATEILLEEGAVVFTLPARADSELGPASTATLEVTAGQTRIRAGEREPVFTQFRVVYGAFAADVTVLAGDVDVVTRAGSVRLHAGDRWPVVAPPGPTPAPPSSPPAPHTEEAAPEPATAPPSAQQPALAKPKPAASGSALGLQARYEHAAQIEGVQPERAEAIYRSLSEGHGDWAETALFALARLELERGRVEQARKSLTRYLARYPQGRNAEDAVRLLRLH